MRRSPSVGTVRTELHTELRKGAYEEASKGGHENVCVIMHSEVHARVRMNAHKDVRKDAYKNAWARTRMHANMDTRMHTKVQVHTQGDTAAHLGRVNRDAGALVRQQQQYEEEQAQQLEASRAECRAANEQLARVRAALCCLRGGLGEVHGCREVAQLLGAPSSELLALALMKWCAGSSAFVQGKHEVGVAGPANKHNFACISWPSGTLQFVCVSSFQGRLGASAESCNITPVPACSCAYSFLGQPEASLGSRR
eukprot:scaffold176417_cov22-Tisochrysis_lutea.AAC.1